jgi:hypothetical protein
VLLIHVTLAAAVPPKLTVAPLAKFVPVIVTTAPPAVGPLAGATFVIVGAVDAAAGGATAVNAPAAVDDWPSPFVTVTSRAPAECAGATAVSTEGLIQVTLVAAVPPNVTVAVLAKLLPVIVTIVPPVVGPLEGPITDTEGAGSLCRLYDCCSFGVDGCSTGGG